MFEKEVFIILPTSLSHLQLWASLQKVSSGQRTTHFKLDTSITEIITGGGWGIEGDKQDEILSERYWKKHL